MRKITKRNIIVTNYMDATTGEVLETHTNIQKHITVIRSKEMYVSIFAETVSKLEHLQGAELKLFMWCAVNAQVNSNIIHLTKYTILEAATAFKVNEQTVRNCISKLVKTKMLVRLNQATYQVNPTYSWKGDTHSRSAAMKLLLQECSDC
jgi:Firmicute plasmid replication protein (RepL)